MDDSKKPREFWIANNWDECMFVFVTKSELLNMTNEKTRVIEYAAYQALLDRVAELERDLDDYKAGAWAEARVADEYIAKCNELQKKYDELLKYNDECKKIRYEQEKRIAGLTAALKNIFMHSSEGFSIETAREAREKYGAKE